MRKPIESGVMSEKTGAAEMIFLESKILEAEEPQKTWLRGLLARFSDFAASQAR